MAFRFNCQNCGNEIVAESRRGELAICKHCGAINAVPQTASEITLSSKSDLAEDAPIVTFTAWQPQGFRKQREWTVRLMPEFAELSCPETGDQFTVLREQARKRIIFRSGIFGSLDDTVTVRPENGRRAFILRLDKAGKRHLQSWLPPRSAAEMRKDLLSWGIGLIAIGILHFLLAGFLDPVWGGVIITIGVLNLLIRKRGMYIVNGMALILVGIMNFSSSVIASTGGISGWSIFGTFQVIWGIQEIRKFAQYAPKPSRTILVTMDRSTKSPS